MGCSQAERGMGLRLPEPVVHLLRRPSQPVVYHDARCFILSACLFVCLLIRPSQPVYHDARCFNLFACLFICLFIHLRPSQPVVCHDARCFILSACLFVFLFIFAPLSLRRIIQFALVCLFCPYLRLCDQVSFLR